MASTPHIKYINRHYQVLPNKNNIRDSNNFDPYRPYPTKVTIIESYMWKMTHLFNHL